MLPACNPMNRATFREFVRVISKHIFPRGELYVPEFGTAAFTTLFKEAIQHFDPDKRARYWVEYCVVRNVSEFSFPKDMHIDLFIKYEIKNGYGETQFIHHRIPVTLPNLSRTFAGSVDTFAVDTISTARGICNYHSMRVAAVELVHSHVMLKWLERHWRPDNADPIMSRIYYPGCKDSVSVGTWFTQWLQRYDFAYCSSADFSKFDSRQRDEFFRIAIWLRRSMQKSMFGCPLLKKIVDYWLNPRTKQVISVRDGNRRKTMKVTTDPPLTSGYVYTSVEGTMRNVALNLAMIAVDQLGWGAMANGEKAFLAALGKVNFGLMPCGDDQLRFSNSERLLSQMDRTAAQLNQKITGGKPYPIEQLSRASIVGGRLVRFLVEDERGQNLQWVLQPDWFRNLTKTGWKLHEGMDDREWRLLQSLANQVLFASTPVMKHVKNAESRLACRDVLGAQPKITSSVLKDRSASKYVYDQQVIAELRTSPALLAAATRAVDAESQYKPWKQVVAGTVLHCVRETWVDLSEAYCDGDICELERIDRAVADLFATADHLPAFVCSPDLEKVLANACA